MKRGLFLLSLSFLLAVSCTVNEFDTKVPASFGDEVFYASLESYSEPDTKVYVDEHVKILWDEKDQISIFNLTTKNQQFEFAGKTGENSGFFNPVATPDGPEDPLAFICAVYPYNNTTKINKEGVMTLNLPSQQTYREGSFGPGANTMVSATEDRLLKFKNVGGYLVLKFYGEGVSVSSIKLEGNNGELLSGKATFTPALGELPKITMDKAAGTSITLNCETPVKLGATKEEAVQFWMVVPPTVFTKGFKLTVTDPDGNEFIKETSSNLSIARNGVLRIAPIRAVTVPIKYAKISSLSVGSTYLIVDASDTRLLKGDTDGSYQSISPDNGVITDTDGSFAKYEFTVENDGDNYYLKYNDGKYLVCDYRNDGASGFAYVDTPADVIYPYVLSTGANSAFFFSTTQVNDTGKKDQVLYYKAPPGDNTDIFKIGGSGRTIGVHLYLKNGVPEPVKQDRGLSFNLASVTCTMGDIPEKPVLDGIYTAVTYSSSDESIAKVDANGKVTLVATGTVTITATAEEDDEYNAGTASYTLIIKRALTPGTYIRVTSLDEIKLGGEYVIAYESGTTMKAFKPILNGSKNAFLTTGNTVDVHIVDDGIEASEADDCRFTLANQDGANKKFSLVVPEADGSTDYYLIVYGKENSTSSEATTVFFASPTATGYRSTFSLSSDGKLTLAGNSSRNFIYSSGSFTAVENGVSSNLYLFVRSDGPVKKNRGLSFNPTSVTCFLGETPEKPVLDGVYTTVTYSSSDESIARVDANGKVTPAKTGTVTITASAAEDDQYRAGSATYTLKIKKVWTSDTYERVTSMNQVNTEGEYVLVYQDGSVQKVFKPVLNSNKDAYLTSAANARNVAIYDDEIEAAEVDDCRIMLANHEGAKYSLVVPEADGTSDYYFVVYGRENPNNGTMTVFFASPTATGFRSTFSLSADGKLTLAGNSGYNFLYNSSGYFTAGNGSSSNLYLFVRNGGPVKQKQSLSFPDETVNWSMGDGGYEIGGSYPPQSVFGAQTTVTYTVEPESVAKVENGMIKIISAGTATITASAAKSDKYYAASASYSLRIRNTAGGWVDLGSFSLENAALTAYLNDAEKSYTDTDDATNTVMPKYVSGTYASISRKDCPAPVHITWADAASRSTVVSIYENDTLDKPVWTQNASDGATSADVYNLIPGRTYYYTVSENDTVWEKGYFSTTGRRRMMKVSDTKGKARANNCRDLGGLEVMDNGVAKTLRYGLLYRGSCLDATTDTEKNFLVGFMNVGLDVDLRDGNSNNPGQGNDGNSVCYQAFGAGYNVAYNSQKFASGQTIADLTTPEKVKNVLMDIFNTLESGKSVYFHCHIGADRTGYMAMLIEGLLGVSEKDCSIDYELTSFSDAAGSRYRNGEPVWYTFRDGIKYLRDLPGTTFQNKIENYLVNTVGIKQEDIDDFKSRLIE